MKGNITELEQRLKGTPKGYIIEELLTNSIHFPVANSILELLLNSDHPAAFLLKPDGYVMFLACLVQAYFLGIWKYRGQTRRVWGNLIGPTLYTLFEFLLEGMEFFESPNHLAYWGFSLAIGILQEIGTASSFGMLKHSVILIEHLVRTNILLATYWIFEVSQEFGGTATVAQYLSFQAFFADLSHQYIAIVLCLLGLVIGFAHMIAANYLNMLQRTASTLRKYSEWFFGRELLSQAVVDASILTIKRRERTVLFMDIRGFTSWSETKSPEDVVAMLNAYFETAEQCWAISEVIKVKHTADEILAVFPTPQEAIRTAIQLREEISRFLRVYGLAAGIGVHCGQLVEGVIGSKDVKMYDIIGDTVNTGKRICDKAAGGEVLISQECYAQLQDLVQVLEPRDIDVKGKREALHVYPVHAINSNA